MGLRELAQTIAKTGFTAAGNIPRPCLYRSKTAASPSYNSATGAVTDLYTDYSVSMIFGKFKTTEIDGQAIRLSDTKAMIPSIDLAVSPKENDIVIRDGIVLEVIKIKVDPAEALWVFQLRRP